MTSCPRCRWPAITGIAPPRAEFRRGALVVVLPNWRRTLQGTALASRRNDPSPHTGVVAFVALRRSQRPVFGADQPKSPVIAPLIDADRLRDRPPPTRRSAC
jgi:hypothetical protein